MHFPSETGELCTAGSRGVTPNPTPPPPLAFLLPLANRSGPLRAPLMGQDLWPHFRAQKDKLFRSYCGDIRSYFLQLSAFWGVILYWKEAHASATAPSLQKPPLESWLMKDNLQQRGEANISKCSFLRMTCQASWSCACQHPCPTGVIPTSNARSCESNHSKTIGQMRSVSNACT